MGHRDVSAPMSPCSHSPTELRLLGFTAGAGSLCANSRAFHSGSLWIRPQICSELCSCGVCPKLKEMFILQNVFFCQWLIPVHPCCHSRDTISVATNKRNLCTETSGPAWVFVTDAMLSNDLVAYTNTFPAKPMKVTETNCCNVLPTDTGSQILVPWECQTPKDLDLMFDNIWAYSATKRKWNKLPTLEMPPDVFLKQFPQLPSLQISALPLPPYICIRNAHNPPEALGKRNYWFSWESLFLAAKDISSSVKLYKIAWLLNCSTWRNFILCFGKHIPHILLNNISFACG